MVHCGVLEVAGVIGECDIAAKANAKELIRGGEGAKLSSFEHLNLQIQLDRKKLYPFTFTVHSFCHA